MIIGKLNPTWQRVWCNNISPFGPKTHKSAQLWWWWWKGIKVQNWLPRLSKAEDEAISCFCGSTAERSFLQRKVASFSLFHFFPVKPIFLRTLSLDFLLSHSSSLSAQLVGGGEQNCHLHINGFFWVLSHSTRKNCGNVETNHCCLRLLWLLGRPHVLFLNMKASIRQHAFKLKIRTNLDILWEVCDR